MGEARGNAGLGKCGVGFDFLLFSFISTPHHENAASISTAQSNLKCCRLSTLVQIPESCIVLYQRHVSRDLAPVQFFYRNSYLVW